MDKDLPFVSDRVAFQNYWFESDVHVQSGDLRDTTYQIGTSVKNIQLWQALEAVKG